MPAGPDKLDDRFYKLCQRLALRGNTRDCLADLRARYEQPQRFYHNLAHIEACLHHLDSCAGQCASPDAIETALWFHDAVYTIGSPDNEVDSASLAAFHLAGARAPQPFIEAVRQLILSTCHTGSPVSGDDAWIADIDLAILGQPQHVFDAYEHAIRREYAIYDDATYQKGRAGVLQRLLERQRIFFTPHFHDLYESAARANLKRSFCALRSGG
jgi:predicted metal-dependent HD superfamily phosphohydrolase